MAPLVDKHSIRIQSGKGEEGAWDAVELDFPFTPCPLFAAVTRIFAFAFIGLCAARAAAAPTHDPPIAAELVALEKQSWVAWQQMDAAFWEGFLSDDHIELNGLVGAVGKKAVIAGIASKQCVVRSYKVDRFTFRQLSADTAVLIYHAEQDTSCGSIIVPSPVWATSVYQLRNGRWLNVLYEHTPALEPQRKPH